MGLPEYEMGGNLGLGELRSLAEGAGVPARKSAVAAAIAKAESGGRPRAYNGRGLDRSYGLWQINMIGVLGPARRRRFGIRSNDELFDPRVNARAMSIISSKGRFWGPWTTYTSGAYRRYLGQAEGAEGEFRSGPGRPPADATEEEKRAYVDSICPPCKGNGIFGSECHECLEKHGIEAKGDFSFVTDWASGVTALAKFIVDPKTWIRAGEAVGGGVLILLGTYFVIRDVRPSEGRG